jgi:imidazolonepropionase-like amidohydrolase
MKESTSMRLLVLVLCVVLIGVASPLQVTGGVVLRGVTVVNTRDGSLLRDMDVIIDGGKIANILPAAEVTVGRGAQNVDARGKFVVPGYLDMHAHSLQSNDVEGSLTLMLANGITGFRQMAGSPELLEARRQGKPLPTIYAPEVLAMPGTILTRANAATPALAVAEVQRQKAMGADFIKVIDTNATTFPAIAAEANRLGIPFLGHLPETVDVRDTARLGMHSIEHLGPNASVLLGCSTDEAALRDSIAHKPAAAPPVAPAGDPADLIVRATTNPIAYADPFEFTLMQRVLDTYNEPKCRQLAATFVAAKTWQVPTLIRSRTMELGDDPQYRDDPNLRYVAPQTRKMWQEVEGSFPTRVSPAARTMLKAFFLQQLQLTKLFDDAGVKMLAGTDSGGSAGWCLPGFALHAEFDLLEQAGISPLHVLQMTTLNGAVFMGREATMGTVEVGKDANLVVLDANPMVSSQNLHKIVAVVRAGTFYARSALDLLEKKTADRNVARKGDAK